MKTVKEAAIERWEKDYGSGNTGHHLFNVSIEMFESGVEFAERWIPMNELKEIGVEYLFKTSNGSHVVGKFEFIENKLCVATESSYTTLDYSIFTHFRPINHK